MRPRTQSQLKIAIDSFDFVVTPLAVDLKSRGGRFGEGFFYLQLQKGMQLMRRLDQHLLMQGLGECRLKQSEHLRIKLRSVKNVGYRFSLYFDGGDREQFVDVFGLELLSAFERYCLELNHNAVEFTKILQAMYNKEQIGKSWVALKQQLREHHQTFSIVGSDGLIALTYEIELLTELDRYVETRTFKSKLNTKSSIGSRKSNSSRNSVNEKKEKKGRTNSVFVGEKSQGKTHCQSKRFSEMKKVEWNIELQSSPSAPSLDSLLHSPSNSPSNSPKNSQVSPVPPEQTTLFLPLQSVIQKKSEMLSDIIERSYQGQSNMNSVERTDRKWKQLPEIKQEMGIPMRKTEKAIVQKQFTEEQQQLRRGNSLKLGKRSQSEGVLPAPSSEDMDDMAEQSEICLPSQHDKVKEQSQGQKPGLRLWLLLVVVCAVCFCCSWVFVFQRSRGGWLLGVGKGIRRGGSKRMAM